MEKPVNADRRKAKSVQEWATIVALIFNFGGLVWFAATLNANVATIQVVQTRQNTVIDKMLDKLSNLDTRVSVNESLIRQYIIK